MATKPTFVDQVTKVPAVWANNVSNLVYDVFGLASTVGQARTNLGLGSAALQDAGAIALTGGSIEGVAIGLANPKAGRFTSVQVSVLQPTSPSHVTSKQYVDQAVSAGVSGLGLGDMSKQNSALVNISGGGAVFDILRVRNNPVVPTDVVTLAFLNAALAPSVQAQTPMAVAVDNQTVSLPFTPVAGRVVLFVDGIYQLPDQYTLVSNTAVFAVPLAPGAVVGGFQL